MTNPLLEEHQLPPFSKIKAEQVLPAVEARIADNRKAIADLLNDKQNPTWDNTIVPLEAMEDRLSNMWSGVRHMNSVVNSDQLRDAYNASLPKLSEYHSELSQDKRLYQAYKKIAEEETSLSDAKRKSLELELREFRLSGIELSEEAQTEYRDIVKQLSNLSTKFENHVMDATDHFALVVEDVNDLKGLPDAAIAAAKEKAQAKEKVGYLLTLDFPSYHAVATYCDNRHLREQLYTAYVTRASDQGPGKPEWDNSETMVEIMKLRLRLAKLLGFENYSALSIERKMAEKNEQVIAFLEDMVAKARPQALQEFADLKAYASKLGCDDLKPWDIAYFSEKLQIERFSISQEACRPYFPTDRVLKGLFTVTEKLYGVQIKEVKDFEGWHQDAKFFEIYNSDGSLQAKFYMDLYARKQKRGGAWMDECRVRWQKPDGELQIPVAYLTCNFRNATADTPALLTHDDVITLFHEFGHGLHHMLTKIDCPAVSGINGVPWDAVELPSQFYENWCWQSEALAFISGHYETGEPLPSELLQNLLAAKNFHSAMALVRQLEFSLFDFKLHQTRDEGILSTAYIQQVLDEVRRNVTVVPTVSFNRFQHGFSHIFGGGYAAGYYSYLWAEVLSADAFARFEEEGIFNKEVGQAFLENILEKGGAYDIMDLFVAFRGRKPSTDALLRQRGID